MTEFTQSQPERRRGLGRGLGALIPTGPAVPGPADIGPISGSPTGGPRAAAAPGAAGEEPAAGGAYFQEIPIQAISPNPRQPRVAFDEEALAELVLSIREVGLLQPVVVRPLGSDQFELVMGERRLRAAREAGLVAIPAIVRETAEAHRLRDALLENLHRQALNPLEEAAAYSQLLEDFDTTHEELAGRIGRSRSQVSNTIRLLNLPAPVQRRVAAGVLSAGHARALLSLDDAAAQEQMATRIVAEGLSVRAVEEAVHVAQGAAAPDRGRAARRAAPTAPAIDELAARLADFFETRVSVAMGRRRGKVVVEFASIDDLERIVALMAPDLPIDANGA
ncbi:MAG TPA: ParB/RepB/Spo0J family partition protein [Mycobacteriales bacterium]|nr:ParB/RepB/Spo0J family partition protein [Mycobacteriales bacterium]